MMVRFLLRKWGGGGGGPARNVIYTYARQVHDVAKMAALTSVSIDFETSILNRLVHKNNRQKSFDGSILTVSLCRAGLALESRVKHDGACMVTAGIGDRYVLGLLARPHIALESDSLQTLQTFFC